MPKRYMLVYTLSEHVFFQSMTGPALCEPAASGSALASVLSGIDVWFFVSMCLLHNLRALTATIFSVVCLGGFSPGDGKHIELVNILITRGYCTNIETPGNDVAVVVEDAEGAFTPTAFEGSCDRGLFSLKCLVPWRVWFVCSALGAGPCRLCLLSFLLWV